MQTPPATTLDIKTRAPLRATYRVQLNAQFGFRQAAQIAVYLKDLGISHLYCSPYLQAASGSTHGYDVVNYHQVSQELGGEDELSAMDQALRSNGLGQVLDVVPNHMAITGRENPWWWDVLTNGPSSRYAAYFDVEWNPPEARHANVVLVPVLGDHYGRVLDRCEINIAFDGRSFTVRYFEHTFPVDPCSVSLILASAAALLKGSAGEDQVSFLAEAFDRLPNSSATDRESARRRYRDGQVLYALLARAAQEQPEVKAAIDQAVQQINADPAQLDVFLELQNYRLAFWRIARAELGYRRFFDINTMAGLRMEDERVYLDAHARVLEWLESGMLDGLRIDHPDGLVDPLGYLRRLRQAAPKAWIVIEKILEDGERLPPDWPVQGTSGYDFLNRVNGLFIDPTSESEITRIYQEFTGERASFDEIVVQKKALAARQVLGSDLERLTALFLAICESHRAYRDYLQSEIRAVLVETAAHLPVYRTYVRPEEGQVSESDRSYIDAAIEQGKARREDVDPQLFDFFGAILLLEVKGERESELVRRFQQYTGPVMAKGVEDTAFYVYNRFVSLNEVGGNPGRFGLSVDAFHQLCAETLASAPYTMLATSTHDTKRSEDVRGRLNVLSNIPARWQEAIRRWALNNQRYRIAQDNPVAPGETIQRAVYPDRNAEYLLYQAMVGAWPLEEARAQAYMEKAAREAKVYTSWRDPNPAYEDALKAFIHAIYADERFLKDLESFVDTIVEAGYINSLSQTLIKLTAPGVPDIYQGCDLWNFSLVDPDNRRPVDYEQRRTLLAELNDDVSPDAVMARIREGLPKLWVTRQALAARRRNSESFGPRGAYSPLAVSSTSSGESAVAYLRGDDVAVVTPRFPMRKMDLGAQGFVQLPEGTWRNLLTHEHFDGGKTPLAGLFTRFPVALLVKEA